MTSNTESKSGRTHKPLTRVLAFLLFALIAYGATAETVHSHGGLLLARNTAGKTTATTAASNPGDANSSSQQTRNVNDCVICQLHQHLSTTLFSSLPGTAPPPTQPALGLAIVISYSLQNSTAQRGRAPPLTSLV